MNHELVSPVAQLSTRPPPNFSGRIEVGGSASLWLASMRAGGGHLALRDAMFRTLQATGHTVSRLDSGARAPDRAHRALVRLGDWALRLSWQLADLRTVPRLVEVLFPRLVAEAHQWVEAAAPGDVMLSTHFAQALALTAARARRQAPVRVVSVLPDYTTPPSAFCPDDPARRADGYVTMSTSVAEHLIERRSVAPERVYVGGYQAAPAFARARLGGRALAWNRVQALAGATRLQPEKPTVLLLGGSGWTARTQPVLRGLLDDPRSRDALNFIVVAGRDDRFHARAERLLAAAASGYAAGFVSHDVLASLMVVADVPVLGSIAPATLQELVAAGCGPLCIFRHLGGSEEGHPAAVVAAGLGLHAPRAGDMVRTVHELTGLLPRTALTAAALEGWPELAAGERARQQTRAAGLGAFLHRVVSP